MTSDAGKGVGLEGSKSSPSLTDDAFVDSTKGPPWHLVDIFHDISDANEEFHSLSIDVRIHQDIPRSVNLYVCAFGGRTSLGPFYGGLQTNVGCPASTPEVEEGAGGFSQRAVPPAPGCIFSHWGAQRLRDVNCPPESFAEAGGYEGTFVSIRKHFPDETAPSLYAGDYTLALQSRIDDECSQWVDYTVNGALVGSLRFAQGQQDEQPQRFFIGDHIYHFVEIYGQKTYAEDVPPCLVSFCRPMLNGRAIDPIKTSAHFYPESPLWAAVSYDADAQETKVRVGAPFITQTHETVELHCRRKSSSENV